MTTRPTVLFVLEQALGHVTHARNLRRLVPRDERIEPVFADVAFEPGDRLGRVPVWSNWTVRAGVRARTAIRRERRSHRLESLFIHTQVPAVLNQDVMRTIPTVVSLDATPLQYDSLGAFYRHEVGSGPAERVKHALNARCYRRAAHLVTWSDWTKADLVDSYGVQPDDVTVIPPGVDPSVWERRSDAEDEVFRILFVGGDVARKGGHDLLEAFRRLRSPHGTTAADGRPVELHLVTPEEVPEEPDVHVHRSLGPNSPELIDLYHRSSVFCLPTHGDCLPMVLSEAGAARLPLISTAVGAIPEIVREGETGLLIEPGDRDALTERLHHVVARPDIAAELGANAVELVRRRYDAASNAASIVDVVLRTMSTSGPAA